MSPRLLFLLNARSAPSWRRAGRASRGLSDRDWMDAQAAASRMPGRRRAAKVVRFLGRADRAARRAGARADRPGRVVGAVHSGLAPLA
jgi:hypothetical protein